MGARVAQRVGVPILLALGVLLGTAAADAEDKLNELQARFDSEANGVRKAKMIPKLGDAEFDEAVTAEKAGNFSTVGLLMEKYRDNVKAASDALEKDNPDGERHPNGYKQLEMHLQKGLRELDEFLLEAPDPFKPPLQLVRKDLLSLDDKLLRSLFPKHHWTKPAETPKPADGAPPGPVAWLRRGRVERARL
jgi:hypothetical protein